MGQFSEQRVANKLEEQSLRFPVSITKDKVEALSALTEQFTEDDWQDWEASEVQFENIWTKWAEGKRRAGKGYPIGYARKVKTDGTVTLHEVCAIPEWGTDQNDLEEWFVCYRDSASGAPIEAGVVKIKPLEKPWEDLEYIGHIIDGENGNIIHGNTAA